MKTLFVYCKIFIAIDTIEHLWICVDINDHKTCSHGALPTKPLDEIIERNSQKTKLIEGATNRYFVYFCYSAKGWTVIFVSEKPV